MNDATNLDEFNDENETLAETENQRRLRVLLLDLTDTIVEQKKEIPLVHLTDLEKVLDIIKKEIDNPTSSLAQTFKKQKIHPEALQLLDRRIQSIDDVTKLPRREQLTEWLRDYIAEMRQNKNYNQMSKGIAFITFDVRGLKMVNDVMKDHKKGDIYLKRIADHMTENIVPVIQRIIGENGKVHAGRDGGDEMGLVIKGDRDLTEKMTLERFEELAGISLRVLSPTEKENSDKSLIQWINTYIECSFRNEKNEVVDQERLEEFAKKGEDADYTLPEGFELRLNVASGATTLYEVMNEASTDNFKENLDEIINSDDPNKSIIDRSLSIEEQFKQANYTLVGAMRKDADGKSYVSKQEQNDFWIHSPEEIHNVMIKIISRNDVTISLAKLAQRERRRANESEGKLQDTASRLDNCLTEKARLELSRA
ncbi:hypothetical protein KBD81_06315 [Candidatus Woesebacteria bacterium]|nr:hypothetical protein [Candidatus Woesebacteria bacterium]